jgi:phosphotransferase system  glucose/maltose/N-acetylglucosamine-specific IIC component
MLMRLSDLKAYARIDPVMGTVIILFSLLFAASLVGAFVALVWIALDTCGADIKMVKTIPWIVSSMAVPYIISHRSDPHWKIFAFFWAFFLAVFYVAVFYLERRAPKRPAGDIPPRSKRHKHNSNPQP